MQTVEQIAAAIVAREGGYVDDPDDPGGATNHGVTIGTLRSLGLDLDGNGRVDKADVRRLDPAQAARKLFASVEVAADAERLLPRDVEHVLDLTDKAVHRLVRTDETLV